MTFGLLVEHFSRKAEDDLRDGLQAQGGDVSAFLHLPHAWPTRKAIAVCSSASFPQLHKRESTKEKSYYDGLLVESDLHLPPSIQGGEPSSRYRASRPIPLRATGD